MANLEGVKVIDMQDGEIMKIAYGGEEYAYTNTEEERGDIALVVDDWGGLESGEYYNVIKSEHHLYNNDSDEYVHIQGKKGHASCFRRRVRLFRKVSSSTIAERVDELETRVSALEAEETDESPKEYDKPAQVGDTILITDARGTSGLYDDGDKLTVRKIDDDNDVVGVEEFEDFKYIDNVEFNIIGRKSHKDFSVGDYAKVVGETYFGNINEGSFVKITREVDRDGDHRIRLIDGTGNDHAKPGSLEKIDEKDLVFIKNGREPGEYRKGDIVRVIDARGSILNEGDIGEVSEEGDVFRVNTAKADYGNYRNADKIEPIVFVEQRVDKVA